MKKRSGKKEHVEPSGLETDIAGLIDKVMQKLSELDRKIDALANKPQGAPSQPYQFQKTFRRDSRPEHHGGQNRQDSSFRERILHKAVCADCGKECEVPFKPSGNRPVYCKECFGKRKDDKPFHGNREERAAGSRHRDNAPFYHKFVESAGKPAGRKKAGARKRGKKT